MWTITGLFTHYRTIQVVCHGIICTSRPIPAQSATTGPGRVSIQPPYGGSFNGEQNIGAALSRVVCTAAHLDTRLHESFRPNKTFGPVVLAQALRYRIFVRGTSAATLQSSRRNCLDRQRKWRVSDKKRHEAGWPIVESAVWHSTAIHLWRKIWSDDKRNKKTSDWLTKKEDCLTDLRFANDVLLFSTSLRKLE